MLSKKHWFVLLALVTILALLLTACGPAATPTPVGPKEVKLLVWAQAGATEGWRADAPVAAGKTLNAEWQPKGTTVIVEGVNDPAGWADYKKKFTLAADAGQAPDIVLSGHEDVPVWAQAGYIVPLDDCIKNYKEFNDVIPSLWNSTLHDGKKWAIPQDTEARPMFFSIPKLKALGWTDAQIAELPKKIEKGEFTLDDMIATAKEAVAKGVVEKGYGYWHRPRKGGDFMQYYYAYGGRLYDEKTKKLVITKSALTSFYTFQRRVVTEGITPEKYIGMEWSIWHDTVARGKALFFNGGIWQWSDWAANYVKDLGGREYLQKTIGYALQPAGVKGKPGSTLSHPLVYMVTSKKASGKDNQEWACRLLAKTTTPELNTKHALQSTHLAILTTQLNQPEYKAEPLLSGTAYMSNFAWFQPNHPQYSVWFDIVYKGMEDAENGVKTVDQAVADAIKQLQVELGDQVIVE